jgi:Flp pilus assembly protein TadG
MVEFAFIIPVFLLLLFGLIDFARLLFTYTSMANGAREFARSVTITANNPTAVANAYNNLTIVGGQMVPSTSVTLAPGSGLGSGSTVCTGTGAALCTLQVTTTGASAISPCLPNSVCVSPATNTTGAAAGTANFTCPGGDCRNFTPNLNPVDTSSGPQPRDFVMLTWLNDLDQNSLQQGYIQVCPLPFADSCNFPSAPFDRRANTNGFVQVDVRYNFQFNPLFQNRLAGVIDVSFMRPSSLVTTTVRTYAE